MHNNISRSSDLLCCDNSVATQEPYSLSDLVEKRRCALRVVFTNLRILPGREFWIDQAITTLSRIDTRSSGAIPERFLDGKRQSGRPFNIRNYAVTSIVGYYYKMLTGRLPARFHNDHLNRALVVRESRCSVQRAGQFAALVYQVFEVLQVKGSADHLARRVAREFKGAIKNRGGE